MRNYNDYKVAAEKTLERSHAVSDIEAGSLKQEAMVYAILALAEAIHENRNLNVNLTGETATRLSGVIHTYRV